MKNLLSGLGLFLLLLVPPTWASLLENQTPFNIKPFSMLLADVPTEKDFAAKLLATELDVAMRNHHGDMKAQFQASLEKFKQSYDFGEVLLQQVVNLLDLEMMIVHCLIRGHTGAMVEDAIIARNQTLNHSVPSVAFMYDKILDLVAYDTATNKKLYAYHSKHEKHLTHALNWSEKKEFLRNMHSKLEHYNGLMRAMQCDFAIGSSTAQRNVRVDRYDTALSFCPVVQ